MEPRLLLDRLGIVELSDLLLHEDHDPARLERLKRRVATEGVQANPVIVFPVSGGRFLTLDGAHRVHALRSLGCSLALVQMVTTPPEPESWSHVVADMALDDLPEDALTRTPTGEWVARLKSRDSAATELFAPEDGLRARVTALRGVQSLYPKGVSVSRTEHEENGSEALQEGETEVSYRAFSVPELVEIVMREDVLPAGITRFRIPERVLGVRFPLDLLRAGDTDRAASELRETVRHSIRENRVRRYREPVILFE